MGIVAGLAAIAISPLLVRYVFKIPASLQHQGLAVFVSVAFALPTLLIQGVLRGALSAYQRFDWINLVNGTMMTLQWSTMVVLAWKGFGVVTIVWVAVAARLLMDVIYFILLRRLVPDLCASMSFCWSTLRTLLNFGAWVSVSQVMSPLLVYLDRMMIATLISLPAVTIYTIPTEIFNRLGVLPSALMATLFPAFSRHSVSRPADGQLTRLYDRTTRYMLMAFLPLFVFLTVDAKDVLMVWMGPRFASEGTVILQILAGGALLNFLARLPFGTVQALGRPDATGKIHLMELPTYVIACLLLIPRWGLMGAAMACTFRVSLDAGLMFWAAHKYCRLQLRWVSDLSLVALIGTILAASMMGVHIVTPSPWAHLGVSVLLLAVCYVSVWMFVLGTEDKPTILRTLRSALQKTDERVAWAAEPGNVS